jgi:hypothetical protein
MHDRVAHNFTIFQTFLQFPVLILTNFITFTEKVSMEHPNIMGVFWTFKSESILPLYSASQKRRYDGQTQVLDLLGLLV